MPRKPNKGKNQTLEARVLDFIRHHRLSTRRDRLVIAVSGGTDSVCLLHLLNQLKAELGIALHAAHLNHMLRGLDSEADAIYVTEMCAGLGVPVSIARRNVTAYQAEHRCSLEEAARQVRYTFLQEVAASQRTDRVAVAHTADDQAETILLHLVRGSGLRGLRGMQPLSVWKTASGEELMVVRPLLEVSRADIEAYCQAHHLSPRYDASNFSPEFLRNRLRQQLLPLLKSYNPAIKEALLRTARLLDEDYAFIEKQAERLWPKLSRQEETSLVLDSARFSRLHPSLQRHLIRRALEQFLGNLRDLEAMHIEQMRATLAGPAGKRLSLPDGLVLAVDYGKAFLSYHPESLCPLPLLEDSRPLKVANETELTGWRVRARQVPQRKTLLDQAGPWQAFFDLAKLVAPLTVRGRRRGDRFQPLGQPQPQKLQDFMVNAKIPRSWRDRVPLVVCREDIVWVVGWRIAEPFKVTAQTKQVLCLEFELL